MTQEKPQPRGLARRKAMLAAAAELFLEKGYQGTSLSDIVDRSKGSRSTLYEQFGSKEGLLRTMIEEETERVWREVRYEEFPPALNEASIVEFGCRLLRAVTAPEAVSLLRILVAEGHRMPEMAALFFDSGPRVLQERMTGTVRAAQEAGELLTEPPEAMTRVFFGAVVGDFTLRGLLGLVSVWSEAELTEYVRTAARMFLNGVRPG